MLHRLGLRSRVMADRYGVVVSGLHSGSGKTLVTLALLRGLQERGRAVRPFKCGPDFIDPRFHEWISGRTSVNLDPYFLTGEGLGNLFDRMTRGFSGGVAEGVMGFYDGLARGTSTYDVARTLNLPVILTVYAKGMADTLASIVRGVHDFRPDSNIRGIIAVQTGSARHVSILAKALEEEGLPPLLGVLPRHESFRLPERHLGLVDVREREGEVGNAGLTEELSRAVSDWKWEDILDFFNPTLSGMIPPDETVSLPGTQLHAKAGHHVRLGVAWDKSFRFYYPENWAELEKRGVGIVPFSPMEDREIPSGLDGIYLGGGYPELFAEELAGNRSFLESIRRFYQDGGFIYAECGGMLYLTQGLSTRPDLDWAGILPCRFRMNGNLRRLGYVSATPVQGEAWSSDLSPIRGHFFHYSELVFDAEKDRLPPAFLVDGQPEGFQSKKALASYLHLYFSSNPGFVDAFVRQLSIKKRDPDRP